MQVLILLRCERTANPFKEGAHGFKACSASLAARLCFQGCSPWSGAGDGEKMTAVLLGGGGGNSASGIKAAERMGAGRSTSDPE